MEKADKGNLSASSRVKSEVSLPPLDDAYIDKNIRATTLAVKPPRQGSFRNHLAKM